ncbi:hypothetical protein [Telmatospirillum sp.]|uniref:hypothetical protein n=1 Tax=Telmatospirillum sp. TaxID=2079197 RepID=UPI0028455E6F|nr:hypothetical protein [Telmatospirillum sp.]MDR3439379.1 hypothetical protein [Telmatospirillum sp.]
MAGGRASFEIQIFHNGHWVTEEFRETELTARAQAKVLLQKPDAQGIRIVKNWTRADGVVTANTLYTEMREPTAPVVNIVAIDEAPFCRETEDYYRLESRITINRLFRKYVDQVFLTPTELIHNYKALKKIQEADTLFPAAVDRVATIQARETGEDPRGRRDIIYRCVAQITAKARRADEYPNLPKLTGNDFGKLCARLETMVPPGDGDFYALVVLSRDLVQHRNWLGKLERLAGLAQPGQQQPAMALLDGVFADLFGVASALQDVLGYQRNLAEALCAIIDLYEGRFVAERSDAKEQIAAITPLIAGGRLEETRKSLMDRIIRQLSSAQPLSRNDPSHEREAFRAVALRLFRPEGLIGGSETAEALTRRFVYLQDEGGKAGLRRAVPGVTTLVANQTFSVVYLLQLAASPLGAELSQDVIATLWQVLGGNTIDTLMAPGTPIRDKLSRVTGLYHKISDAEALPEAERQRLLTHLDTVLCGYVKREGIIEKLDDPKASLRNRATRLIEFCASNLLPMKSKTHALARERVVALLKQPNFEVHFTDGIADPTRCEDSLRAFYALLARAGFK